MQHAKRQLATARVRCRMINDAVQMEPSAIPPTVPTGDAGMSEQCAMTSRRRTPLRVLLVGLMLGLLTWSAAPGQSPEPLYQPLPDAGEAADPPLPGPDVFPVQLVLDDDTAEGTFGVGVPNALQFMWLNQFDPGGFGPFTLEEIWVLFPDGDNIAPGGSIELAVYLDGDADPTNGAELLLNFEDTVQVADGETFSIYPLPEPLVISGGGDVLLGVINRFVDSGVTSETRPATLDATVSQGRSWVAVWSTDPPPGLELPADLIFEPADNLIPGNWMIRGFGTSAPVIEVPTLDSLGLIVMTLLLAAGGAVTFRRRRRLQQVKIHRQRGV